MKPEIASRQQLAATSAPPTAAGSGWMPSGAARQKDTSETESANSVTTPPIVAERNVLKSRRIETLSAYRPQPGFRDAVASRGSSTRPTMVTSRAAPASSNEDVVHHALARYAVRCGSDVRDRAPRHCASHRRRRCRNGPRSARHRLVEGGLGLPTSGAEDRPGSSGAPGHRVCLLPRWRPGLRRPFSSAGLERDEDARSRSRFAAPMPQCAGKAAPHGVSSSQVWRRSSWSGTRRTSPAHRVDRTSAPGPGRHAQRRASSRPVLESPESMATRARNCAIVRSHIHEKRAVS